MHLIQTIGLSLLLCTVLSAQTTWHVPGDFPTIQDAIDWYRVKDGDTVLVRAGTYSGTIRFYGKAITLKSAEGPEVTTLRTGRPVVSFRDGEDLDTVLDGFTITEGGGYHHSDEITAGGGIYCNAASPTIKNNIIIDNECIDEVINRAYCFGGGIACFDSHARIENNVIYSNFLHSDCGARGGGIYCQDSSVVIDQNRIEKNSTWGATYLLHTDEQGSGICCYGGSPVISNNCIRCNRTMNSGTRQGVGIYVGDASAFISNNLIIGNNLSALPEGRSGGYPPPPPPPPYGCKGGGIYCTGSGTTTIVNNTLYGNSVYATGLSEGSGICNEGAAVTVRNTIVWNNVEAEQLAGDFSVQYCDVEGGFVGMSVLDQDPLFLDLENEDFHLSLFSPCINRGTDLGVPATDLDGNPRPYMGTADMGAYEYVGAHLLEADAFSLSQSQGGIVHFFLNATPDNGGREYGILGGYTGTVPGFPLPGGNACMPVNWDAFTDIVFSLFNTSMFQNYYGFLDTAGQGTACFNALGVPLPPKYAWHTLHFAFCLTYPWEVVSNPIAVDVLP